jgi:hypothetical protein
MRVATVRTADRLIDGKRAAPAAGACSSDLRAAHGSMRTGRRTERRSAPAGATAEESARAEASAERALGSLGTAPSTLQHRLLHAAMIQVAWSLQGESCCTRHAPTCRCTPVAAARVPPLSAITGAQMALRCLDARSSTASRLIRATCNVQHTTTRSMSHSMQHATTVPSAPGVHARSSACSCLMRAACASLTRRSSAHVPASSAQPCRAPPYGGG